MRSLLLITSLLFAALTQANDESAPLTLSEPAASAVTANPGPSAEAWQKTVETLGAALADNDPGVVLSVLVEVPAISTFDGKVADAARLLARTRKGALIASFTYTFEPQNMAGDIAESFKAAELPEELKLRMQVKDENHLRRANKTAVAWLAEALAAKTGEKVGVLIFWCDRPANGESAELVFVLVKADTEPASSRIKTVAFGNPTPRPLK